MNKLPSPWDALSSGNATQTQLERLALTVRHTSDECWLDFHYDSTQSGVPIAGETESLRFLLSDTRHSVIIAPQLADRTVVARPMVPTELLPGQHATLFISTALWARAAFGEHILAELPSMRLSDTWFGANTGRGELCYASQTRALLSLENVPHSVFRAITPITIDNQGAENIRLERINVPVPNLTLYCDGERFWTSALRVRLEQNLATASVQIEASPPKGTFLVAPPRRPVRDGVLDRAVDLLFA